MKRRSVILLAGIAAAAVGGAIFLTPDKPDRPAPGQGSLAFPSLASRLQDAERIEVKRHDGTLGIQRRGEVWVLPDKGGYPVRQERVRELLVGLTELRLSEPRTAAPELLSRLGLEDPAQAGATSSLLRVLAEDGSPIAELIIGRRRVRTQGNVPESVYVRRPTETQSWLAEGRLPVDADPQLWLDRDIANLARERVRRVAIRRQGEAELILARPGEADAKLEVTQPAEAPPTDETSLDEVGRAFEFLTFLDVRPEAEIPGESLGEARFELTDGLAVTVRPHKEGETLWIRLSAEGGDEAAQLNRRWRGWAYQVGQWKEKAFVPRLSDLRRQEESQPASAPQPAAEQPAESASTSPPATEDTSASVAPGPEAPQPGQTTPQ